MPGKTKIEWATDVWSIMTGCDKVSAGCKNCYAETFANRWKGIPGHAYEQGFDVRLWPERLDLPRRWKKPRRIFVASMGDLFHEEVPISFIQTVFEVMNECPQHVFQILTKRHERLHRLAPHLAWTPNIWQGVSVEDADNIHRVEWLQDTQGPKVKFLSCEPLLGPLEELPLHGINWVICGGESGHGARLMRRGWMLDIIKQCKSAGVACFMKQTGEVLARELGFKDKKGGDMSEWPEEWRIREYPNV